MEIRVHGPGQEPRAARGHDAHAGQRLRARGRVLPHRRARRDDRRDRHDRVLPRRARGRAALQHRDGAAAPAGRRRRPRAAASSRTRRAGSAARPRSTRSRCGARPSGQARSSRRVGRRRCRIGSPSTSGCSTRRVGCTRPRASPRRELLAVREDVGRHNALDKLIGARAARRGAAARRRGAARVGPACRSSSCRRPRSPGIPVLCAVSAPSSLAVAAAERFGQTVVGFLRGGRFNVYTHPERIDLGRLMASRRNARRAISSQAPGACGASSGSAGSPTASASRSRNHYRGSAKTSGRTGAACRGRGASCARACATGARSASPGSTTGRSAACTSARPASTSCRSTPRARSTPTCAGRRRRARRKHNGRELRELGRLAHPMVRHRGERGLHPRVVGRRARPDRGPHPRDHGRPRRALPDRPRHHQRGVLRRPEGGAVPRHEQRRQRGARLSRAVDDGARRRRSASAATTCSYRDVIDSDLIVLFGADVANAQPVFMKYLYLAKQARAPRSRWSTRSASRASSATGCRRNVESAMFGTKMTDEFFPRPHRRRRRVRQRRAQAPARDRRRRPASS